MFLTTILFILLNNIMESNVNRKTKTKFKDPKCAPLFSIHNLTHFTLLNTVISKFRVCRR